MTTRADVHRRYLAIAIESLLHLEAGDPTFRDNIAEQPGGQFALVTGYESIISGALAIIADATDRTTPEVIEAIGDTLARRMATTAFEDAVNLEAYEQDFDPRFLDNDGEDPT